MHGLDVSGFKVSRRNGEGRYASHLADSTLTEIFELGIYVRLACFMN